MMHSLKNNNMNEKIKIISVSCPRKNIKMVVYHNVGPDGKRESITRFEAQNPLKACYRRFPLGGKAVAQ